MRSDARPGSGRNRERAPLRARAAILGAVATLEESPPPPPSAALPERARPPLELLVFVVGSSTLGAEIAAARLMAPFFGASTIVWANTIAVVLVALSIGYWLGGRLADRHPHLRGLCTLVLAAAALLAIVPFVAHPFLALSVRAFDEISVGASAGSLFGDAGARRGAGADARRRLALGDPAPLERVEDSGAIAGRLYAIGTVGLAGRHVPRRAPADPAGRHAAHVPRSSRSPLAAVAAAGLRARFWLVPAAVAALLPCRSAPSSRPSDGPRARRGRDAPTSTRAWSRSPTACASSSSTRARPCTRSRRADTVLTGDYWDGFLVLPFAAGSRTPPRRIAILGNAGGTDRARLRRTTSRRTRIDAVDIDGKLFEIGRQLLRPAAAPAAAHDRAGRAAVPAPHAPSATTRSSSTPTASPTSRST